MIKKSFIAIAVISLIICNIDLTVAQIKQITYVGRWTGFDWIEGIDIDRNGNVYLAEIGNNRILVYTGDGRYLRQWGGSGSGHGQFYHGPCDLAIDQSGNVYVTEGWMTSLGPWRVQVFTNNGSFIRSWDASDSRDGLFYMPYGIDINDSTGDVYVADVVGENVKVFTNTGTCLDQWDNCAWGTCFLFGLEIDQTTGDIYVACETCPEVWVFSQNGTFKGTISDLPGAFDIALDQRGHIFVTTEESEVRVYNKNRSFITGWNVSGVSGGIAISKDNRVYITDYENGYIYIYQIVYDNYSNLTPFQPSGWSDKIVISNQGGTHTDDSIEVDQRAYIDFAYENNGTFAAKNYNITVYIDDNIFYSDRRITDLPPGSNSIYRDREYTFTNPGTHRIKLVCDSENEANESNEADNIYEKTINVINKLTPNLTPYQPSGWSDKIVVSNQGGTHTDDSIEVDQKAYIDFAYENNGGVAAKNYNIKVYIDDTLFYNDRITTDLQPDWHHYYSDLEYTFTGDGSHRIRLVCDSGNELDESNETDNVYEKTINVINKLKPNLTPYQPSGWSEKIVVSNRDGTYTDDSIRVDQKAYIDFAYENSGGVAAKNYNITVYIDDKLFYSDRRITDLLPGNNAFYQDREHTFTTSGSHRIRLVCDSGNELDEFNEVDNVYERTINIEITPKAELVGLEVNQAVQDWNNAVRLIENKKTYVRAHIQSKGEESFDVTARLYGSRNGIELPGSPLSPINPKEMITARPNASERRSYWNGTLNFELPPDWLHGTIVLRLDSANVDLEYKEPSEPGGVANDGIIQVTFDPAEELEVMLVAINWTDNSGRSHNPTQNNLIELEQRLLAIYPINSINSQTTSLNWAGSVPPDLAAINRHLEAMRINDGCTDSSGCSRLYYGVLIGTRLGGLANGIPGTVASGDMGAELYVHAHELGHCLGRHHSVHNSLTSSSDFWKQGPCGSQASLSAPDFPYIHQIRNRNKATIGPMDLGQDNLIFGLATHSISVLHPEYHFDLMSYCNPFWISDYTYEGLYNTINNTFRPRLLPMKSGNPVEYIVIRGSIDFDNSIIEFLPFGSVKSQVPLSAPPPGDYTLELLDNSGALIRSMAFQPREYISDLEWEEDRVGSFLIPIEKDFAFKQVTIIYKGSDLKSISGSQSSPIVQVLYPNGGEILRGHKAVMYWTGYDTDNDVLTYTVQFSPDGGGTWKTLAVDYPNTSYEIDLNLLKETTIGLIRAKASDGFYTAIDDSDAFFTIPNNEPNVTLISPQNDALFTGEQLIIFNALAMDQEDGRLSGASLRWYSSIDDFIGEGEALTRKVIQLSEGDHIITVTSVDNAGLTKSESIQIRIMHAPPILLSDLGVIASDISDDIYINDEFSYILTVMNHGPDDATNITLVDTLPENVNFISVTSTQGHCIETNGVIECDLKNLPISETAMVTINVKAYSEGMAVNTASIFGDEEDPALINNNLTQYNQIERKLPNLTPYKLSNWDDKIIVSSNTGTFTNDAFIMAGKPVYIDYSYLNNGLAVAQRGYKINLYIDKTLVMTDTIEGDYEPNVYWYRYDYEYVFNNSGIFTIKIACDEENDLEESNEGDNEYSKTIYVNPKGGIIYNINFPAGWSMISLPVMPAKASVSSLFPEAKVVYGYEKGVGYVMVTKEEDLEFGRGYWILFDKAQNYSLTGQPIQSYNHNVFGDGWTMIGGCTSPARALGKSCSIGIIYGYAPGVGYKRVTESDKLQPGKGYWILFSHVMDQAGLTVETCP